MAAGTHPKHFKDKYMPGQQSSYSYDSADLDLIKNKLVDILTRTRSEVAVLAQQHRAEIRPLAEVLRSAKDIHHKWSAVVLAQVPESAWGIGPGGEEQVIPSAAASMRFLSNRLLGAKSEDARKHIEARTTLLANLLEEMPEPRYRQAYRDMLAVKSYGEAWNPNDPRLPLSSDSAFGHSLHNLEKLMDSGLVFFEQTWRQEKDWPESQSTPREISRHYSKEALAQVCNHVAQWCQMDDGLDDAPESLMALVGANLSVNRALLELAAKEARGWETAQMNEQFLQQLNDLGITEVPDISDDPEAGEHALEEILKTWFGHGGSKLKPGQRHMVDSDIRITLDWSRQLQQDYMDERGRKNLDPELVERAHGGGSNRFIFALAIVGAFCCNTRIAYEFTGHSNSTYAVFPDRGQVAEGYRVSPPRHAKEFLMQAYGQIFYANDGWELRPDRIREYAVTASVKRSHLQQLLRFAVKGRSSKALMALHRQLDERFKNL